MFKRILLYFTFSSLLLCGCTDYKQLKVTSCKIGVLKGLSYSDGKASADLRLDVGVDNPTRSSFDVSDIDAILYYNEGKPFAQITSDKSVNIAPGNDGMIPVLLKVTFLDPLAIMFGGLDTKGMYADIEAKFHTGMIIKNFSKKGLSVEKLVEAASNIK